MACLLRHSYPASADCGERLRLASRRDRGDAARRGTRDRKDTGLRAEPADRSDADRRGHSPADPEIQLDYEILETFRKEGGTDYVAMPMVFSSGEINCISWLTDRPGGFTEAEIAGLADVAEMLTVLVETQTHRRIVRILMDTYVGHRTGERVLSGAVKRGDGETIRAVIWYCDLRGFTSLSDALPRDALLDLLNQYFEIMVNAVSAEGGEVLKFIGDGMLAIFELREGDSVVQHCAAALRAARAVREAVSTRNPDRAAAVRLLRGGRS